MRKYLPEVIVLAVYVVFFTVLFLQYPLTGSLVGNTDAIATLAVYKEHILKLKELFLNQPGGNIFYPEAGLTSFCEPYAGETLFYIILNFLGISDFYASFLLIVIFYSLNAFAVFYLAKIYTNNKFASFCGGLAFSSSCYMLCNQEMMNALVFFPAVLSLAFLEKFLISQKLSKLMWCTFFMGLQFYFSTYNFVYAALFIALFSLPSLKIILNDLVNKPWHYVGAIVFLLILISPMVYFIVLSGNFDGVYNPLVEMPGVTERYSFTLNNFLASYPSNLIYRGGAGIFGNLSLKNEYYANLGLAFWGIALFSMTRPFKYRWVVFFTLLGSILFSFGLYLKIGDTEIPMPLALLYKINFWKTFYRIPGRTFVIGTFAASLLFSQGLTAIMARWKRGYVFAFIAMILLLLENIPVPFPIVHNGEALTPPKGYLSFFQGQKLKVTADLPSSLFTGRFQYVDEISEYSREYRYMYWKTLHRNYTINGSGSFFPQSRMHNNDLMKDISANGNLKELIAYNKLDYITFHKKFVFAEEEKAIGPFLASSNLLAKQFENDEIIIYKVAAEKDEH